MYGYFQQQWNDSRLAGKLNRNLTIEGDAIDKFWVPDAYCYWARESNLMMPDAESHTKLKITPNGEMTYSRR